MKNDPLYYPYGSSRKVTYSRKGLVATSQPLAAQAGLSILKKGGNAIDAAVATAACLTVVEPTSNGIGSDAFALIWSKNKLHGLNASGPAPKTISIEALKDKGLKNIPEFGWVPVTVPGAPAAWAKMVERFGQLGLEEVLEPAINYAQNGFPLSPTVSILWNLAFKKYKTECTGPEFKNWFKTFAPNGKAPKAGEMWCSPDHGNTLKIIGKTNAEAFYRGELSQKINAFSRKFDGFIKADDLAEYQPEWVDPIGIDYRGYNIWEIPPNGQGLITLIALKILNGFRFSAKDSVDTYHKQIESLKLGFEDGKKYITDIRKMPVPVESLLDDQYVNSRRKLIGENALLPVAGTPDQSGTVYLATADGEGNMVSFIQSNYKGFGSGLVVDGTGIALQNRGQNFSLDPDHYNCLAPGKKTYHTIIPGFITKNEQAIGPFGVMGGFMQPQGHLQIAMNLIDFGLNPQAALDAPRWQWMEKLTVSLEPSFPNHIAQALARKGHNIVIETTSLDFGRGQIICRDNDSGVLSGGSEPRADGIVAAW